MWPFRLDPLTYWVVLRCDRWFGGWVGGGGLQMVLQADITEFQPYYVQIVAQLLERRGEPIPPSYLQLLPSLLQQPLWASRSNQPALARLIKAYLTRAAGQIVASQPVFHQILGLVQFLMMSKVPPRHPPMVR